MTESHTSIHTPLLDTIGSPADLKKLRLEDLPRLCDEIRAFLLSALSVNPGHLGSNLGVVEATVAMHYVYDAPEDKIVWDVGHQAYIHKLLTGRKDRFSTLRQWGGMSGFPSPSESEYDCFVAGHASNSISAALGMAVANMRTGSKAHTIAFIGDGSMTGGLAFEGLNNASSSPNNLLIILNDNNMSIDRNVGGLNKYMVNLLTSHTYNVVRNDVYRGLKKLHIVNEQGRRDWVTVNNKLKSLVARQNNIFDSFSIRYIGPVDGNDVLRMVQILSDIKHMRGPKLLHISTVKGKGYTPAEQSPTVWHAPGRFNPSTGERLGTEPRPEPPRFQDVFGHTLVELAEQDERIVGITPAMPSGCSMNMLMKAFPDRAYDVGIAESHAVTFASGLASQGLIPFCNIYSSFMQRAYDQLIHDVALQDNRVIFCLDRAGLVGEDGATHQGAFDIAYLRSIPKMAIVSPMDEVQLRHQMYSAYCSWGKTVAIRYPRGKGSIVDWKQPMLEIPFGRGRELTSGSAVYLLSLGPIGVEVARVVDRLRSEGIDAGHVDMVFAKPLDEELLQRVLDRSPVVLTIEEGCLPGGMGSAVAEYIMDRGLGTRLVRLGIPDTFISHGSPDEQKRYCGLDQESIYQATCRAVGRI